MEIKSKLTNQPVSLLKQETFKIIVNKKAYICNCMGVNASNVIRDLKNKNPCLNYYVYNFDGDSQDFQPICDLFNFKDLQITTTNMKSLLQIADDLQIESILNYTSDFNDTFEVIVSDGYKVNDIFEKLYQLDNNSIDAVKKSILKSKWVNSEENIQELVAIILQVAEQRLDLQSYLIDLLISLDKCANKDNSLNILIPYFTKQIKRIFYTSMFYCLFIYKLTKKNIISINEIIEEIWKNDQYLNNKLKFQKNDFQSSYHKNIVYVFSPELIEIKQVSETILFNGMNSLDLELIKEYIPKNIEKFKEIRESEKPDDEVTLAIIHDDVDKLQSVVSTSNKIISKGIIPPYIFDPFENAITKSYIDFACECGSVKCFKYLILNGATLDVFTFGFAIYGNNNEIIHIVEEKMKNCSIAKNKTTNEKWKELLNDPIYLTLMHHQYDLFDWLFDKKVASQKLMRNQSLKLTDLIFKYGNIHSLIKMIDNGFSLKIDSDVLKKWICDSSSKGYYQLLKMIFSLCNCDDLIIDFDIISPQPVQFGNLAIFKLCFPSKNNNTDYKALLIYAMKNQYANIVKYIIDELYDPSNTYLFTIFHAAIESNSIEIFNIFNEKYHLADHYNLEEYKDLLSTCLKVKNAEISKLIIDLLIEKNSTIDFTSQFIQCATTNFIEICNYLLNKKVSINLQKIIPSYQQMDKQIGKIIFNLIEKSKNSEIQLFSSIFFNEAVKNNNKDFIKLLIKNKPKINKDTLFNAVMSHDVELVNLVLKIKNQPFYINQISKDGSVLNVAAANNDLLIVKSLLSIPGINPDYLNKDQYTPLMLAIKNLNYEMIDEFLNFYGNNIQSQVSRISNALRDIIIKMNNKNSDDLLKIIKKFRTIPNIDLNFYNEGKTILINSCINNNIELVKILLDSYQIDTNLYDLTNGNTPLIIACKNKNKELAKLLIEHPQTNINFNNEMNETALTIAVEESQQEIIQLLINNEKFDPDESNLDYAFFICKDQIAPIFSSVKNLNVYYTIISKYSNDPFIRKLKIKTDDKNNCYYGQESIIDHAISHKQEQKIKIILNHPSFDLEKSKIKEHIYDEFILNNIEIFDAIIQKMNNDINIISLNGQSIFKYAIKNFNEPLIRYILNSNFQLSADDFKSAIFALKIKTSYSDLLNEILKYDKNHDNYQETDEIKKCLDFKIGWGSLTNFERPNKWSNTSTEVKKFWIKSSYNNKLTWDSPSIDLNCSQNEFEKSGWGTLSSKKSENSHNRNVTNGWGKTNDNTHTVFKKLVWGKSKF